MNSTGDADLCLLLSMIFGYRDLNFFIAPRHTLLDLARGYSRYFSKDIFIYSKRGFPNFWTQKAIIGNNRLKIRKNPISKLVLDIFSPSQQI